MCMCSKLINCFKRVLAFGGGFALSQLYYFYLLKQIPFPYESRSVISLGLSIILGIGNAISTQLRCITALIFPMYCGKPGRGVLKAVILTYIVTGPITNMGMNAREVVRVFACSSQLSANISREKYDIMVVPVRKASLAIKREVEQFIDGFRKMKDIMEPIQFEIEDATELNWTRYENNVMDDLFHRKYRSYDIERKFQLMKYKNVSELNYNLFYRMKLQYRCENQFSRAQAICLQEFTKTYNYCMEIPNERDHCRPLKILGICDLIATVKKYKDDVCSPPIELSFGNGYAAINRIKQELIENLDTVHLQYREVNKSKLQDFPLANEASLLQAFEEKTLIMQHALTIINICMALLFLRLYNAAVTYHDMYLTSVDYDNVYVTGYFRLLDARRNSRGQGTLLPLKKMERNKYIDIYSLSYQQSHGSNLIMQILKVMLEVVTATTFVMLDRMFYEALEVVRLHAEMNTTMRGTRDLDIEVEGTGILATILRNFLLELNSNRRPHQFTYSACLPHPKQMSYVYFFKIYGGYLWIIILLFASPYTIRLKRLICSYFYPRREKQRILHLYNDILKKRMKMHKTLRRKAVQAVRAHYLSGETLLSARMKFPQLLGWLKILPGARMSCLICGETEPRTDVRERYSRWYSCVKSKCPFVYCAECWREAGARCLACEPSLAELSDVGSFTDSELEQNK